MLSRTTPAEECDALAGALSGRKGVGFICDALAHPQRSLQFLLTLNLECTSVHSHSPTSYNAVVHHSMIAQDMRPDGALCLHNALIDPNAPKDITDLNLACSTLS